MEMFPYFLDQHMKCDTLKNVCISYVNQALISIYLLTIDSDIF